MHALLHHTHRELPILLQTMLGPIPITHLLYNIVHTEKIGNNLTIDKTVHNNFTELLDTLAHLVIFNDAREHDNGATVSLIDHLPEVSAGVLHRPLSDDESLLLLVALYVTDTDIKEKLVNQLSREFVSIQVLTLTKLAWM